MVNPLCHEFTGLGLAVLASDHVEASHVTSCTLFARLFDPKQGSLQEKVLISWSFGRTMLFLMQITTSLDLPNKFLYVQKYLYLAFSFKPPIRIGLNLAAIQPVHSGTHRTWSTCYNLVMCTEPTGGTDLRQ